MPRSVLLEAVIRGENSEIKANLLGWQIGGETYIKCEFIGPVNFGPGDTIEIIREEPAETQKAEAKRSNYTPSPIRDHHDDRWDDRLRR